MPLIISTFAANSSFMLLKDFFLRFPTEDSCIAYFRSIREQVGVVCPRCGSHKVSWLNGRGCFQCCDCGNRISLTKGTVMEHSRMSMYDWFFTMHIMTSFKQVFSAKEIQHQLDKDDYPSIWLMMMKLRDIMGKRDAIYKLSDQIELDVVYFPTSTYIKEEGIKTIVAQKTPVLVTAESKDVAEIMAEYLENEPFGEYSGKIAKLLKRSKNETVKKAVRHIKMFAMANQRHETLRPFVLRYVDENTKVVTDGGKNLIRLKEILKEHESHEETIESSHSVVTKLLPWVHIVTGECRSSIEAIHHDIDERFLQFYLNEYCWKFNRRFFRDAKEQETDLFDHLVRIAALYTSDIKWRDYGFNIR